MTVTSEGRSLQGRKTLLCVGGGIAAYKALELVRRLRERGALVQVAMTEGAQQFVTPLAFQALSGEPTRTSLWDHAAEQAMGHLELARWADEVVVAPATADLIARLANGMANDLVATLCLATEARLLDELVASSGSAKPLGLDCFGVDYQLGELRQRLTLLRRSMRPTCRSGWPTRWLPANCAEAGHAGREIKRRTGNNYAILIMLFKNDRRICK